MAELNDLDDQELIAEFVRSESEEVFAQFVARYLNLVYSTGLRYAGNPHDAEEITQAVFVILARKASRLQHGTVLSGWLYQTARLTAANLVKSEARRRRREQEAYMRATLNEADTHAWTQIAPVLDDAMGRLDETDRNVIVLRFFEKKTAQEIGSALKLTQAAAQKRVNRALERLRCAFQRRGVTMTAVLIAGALSANSVQAAPGHLGASVITFSLGKAAVSASVAAVVKATLFRLLWPKMQAALAIGLGATIVGGSLAAYHFYPRRQTTYTWQKTVRVPPATNQNPPVSQGVVPINFKLQGTPGLPFELEYVADGRTQKTNGILPGEISFSADAFSATVNVRGSGEFGMQVLRGGLQMDRSQVGPMPNGRALAIQVKKGGTGIYTQTLPPR